MCAARGAMLSGKSAMDTVYVVTQVQVSNLHPLAAKYSGIGSVAPRAIECSASSCNSRMAVCYSSPSSQGKLCTNKVLESTALGP
jgi:hypothetical protein